MLPRQDRLTKQKDITKAIRQGVVLDTPYVRVHALKTTNDLRTRVAAIVSKKVHNSAVKRHTYQRWLRESARQLITQLTGHYDIVLIAKPRIRDAENSTKVYYSLKSRLKEPIS